MQFQTKLLCSIIGGFLFGALFVLLQAPNTHGDLLVVAMCVMGVVGAISFIAIALLLEMIWRCWLKCDQTPTLED